MSIFQSPRDLNSYAKTNPVSSVMIVVISAVYATQVLLSLIGINLTRLGAINFVLIYEYNEWYRLVTAIFLHGNLLHYLFNTFFGLYIIGAALERLIGSKNYALTLVIAGLGSSIIVFLWDYISYFALGNQTAILTFTIGASGAIFGAMGYLFYLTLVKPEMFAMQDISSIRGLIFINVIFSFFGNISTSGHFGGLAMGLIVGALLTRISPYKGKKKGFQDPYNRYAQEEWDLEDLDDIFVVDDDDDDDDRRVW